ncbi:MAG: three-Cys-motif partner protein TcmP [Dehalococcoidia bacterium]|nr:three-Cys-motif partner protein TcmP [Dehalococcoidia bacterium]
MARKDDTQILAELAADDDGLRTKPVGVWSLEKLATLLLYFQAFTTACKSVGGGYYVDGLSGPGVCRIRNAQPLPYFAWGSPLLALRTKPDFQRCLFIEVKEASAAALQQRIVPFGARGDIYPGDVNEVAPRLVREEVPPGAPCFCLFDQQGTEVGWHTIASVATTPGRRRKPELMILLPLQMSLLRLLSTNRPITGANALRMNFVYGNDEWRLIYESRLAGDVTPGEAREQYLDLYCNRLRGLQYKYVQSRIIRAPRAPGQRRQDMYYLVFATDHEAGSQIMEDVFRRGYALDFPVTAQPRLL